MSDARLRLAFAGLHPDRSIELRRRFGGASGALRAIELGQVKASQHVRAEAGVDAKTRRGQLASLGATALLRGDAAYPAHLDRYEDAPDVLFVRGPLPLRAGVAIVGTRGCTAYGRELARAYGYAAADEGWPVVSGLARGIDGEAHRGVVDAAGVGVAVFGCGIDVVYPREHDRLERQILDHGGAIVTEYPPGSPPDGWRFPPALRLVAASEHAPRVFAGCPQVSATLGYRALSATSSSPRRRDCGVHTSCRKVAVARIARVQRVGPWSWLVCALLVTFALGERCAT